MHCMHCMHCMLCMHYFLPPVTFSGVSFKPCVCILQDTVLGFHAPIELLVAKKNRFCFHEQRAVRSQCCAWGLSLLSVLTRPPQFECSLAGSWALFGIKLKCQINPDCLQKKRNKCVDTGYIFFFAQYPGSHKVRTLLAQIGNFW